MSDTLNVYAIKAFNQREHRRAQGICICGPMRPGPSRNGVVHGPPDPRDGRCERCREIAKQSRHGKRTS